MEHNRTIENGRTFKAQIWYGGRQKTLQVVETSYIAYKYSKGCYAKIIAKDKRGKDYYTVNAHYHGCRQYWSPMNGRGKPLYF